MAGPGHIPCSVMVGSGTCFQPAGVGGFQFTKPPPPQFPRLYTCLVQSKKETPLLQISLSEPYFWYEPRSSHISAASFRSIFGSRRILFTVTS